MGTSTATAAPPGWRTPAVVVACGCLIAMIGFGVRSTYGLFNSPLSDAHGWGRDVFALALAIQNLLWGIGQPFAGGLADRFGPARVLTGGAVLYGAGVVLSALSPTPLALQLAAGLLVGIGLSGASFGVVIAAFGRMMPPEKRGWATGIATAAGSMGQFLFAPLGSAFIAAYGWQTALMLLGGSLALVPLFAMALAGSGGGRHPVVETVGDASVWGALKQAFGHPSYLLLFTGFFVCGFHLAFITVHMPPYLTDQGADPALAGWSIALIGLFNMAGAYASGILTGRMPKRILLAGIYAARAVAIALFITLPMSTGSVLMFSAAMGLLWLSTIPPTSGLIAVMFGVRHLGMLFGCVFFSHQVGSFLGVWLGGVVFERTGSYDVVWWMGVALGIASALVHWPIAEKPAVPRLQPA